MSNLVVQTNVLALNSHRNLKTVGGKLSQASARLSSGYRINSASDDASGLAISEKMRAQIRGLDMASKNTQDGISLVQTAEGGLQEIDNMLQRIRELTVQASNDTNDYQSADRKKLQEEIDQLTAGIDAMAGQVEFNKKKLLDGSLTDASTKGSLLADINVKMQNQIGQTIGVGSAVSDLASILNTASGGTMNLRLAEAQTRTFPANVSYQQTITDAGTTRAMTNTVDAPTIVNTNTTVATTTGGSAWASTTSLGVAANTATDSAQITVTLTDPVGGNFTTSYSAGASIGSFAVTYDYGHESTQFGAANVAAGSMTLNMHGFDGTADTDGGFTAEYTNTNYDVEVTVTHQHIDMTGATGTVSTNGSQALSVVASSNVSSVQAMSDYIGAIDSYIGKLQDAKKNGATGVEDIMANLAYNKQAALDIYAGLELSSAQTKSYEALNKLDGNSLWFQTGANSEQGIHVGIGKVTSDILGIGKGSGISTIKVDRPNANEVSAQVDIVDNALQYVTSQRAKLGAVQNRMEYTKSSLEVSSENLSAAESRIRDTDMAKEMMKLTSANVLQQAGVSMLSQANQAPQSVLSLLR